MENSWIQRHRLILIFSVLFIATLIFFVNKYHYFRLISQMQNHIGIAQKTTSSQQLSHVRIAFSREDGIYTVTPDGSIIKKIIDEDRGWDEDSFAISPDEKWAIIMDRCTEDFDNLMVLYNLSRQNSSEKSDDNRIEFRYWVLGRDMTFAPDSSKIVYIGSNNKKTGLFSLSINATMPTLIAENKKGIWVDGPTVNQDGKRMVMTVMSDANTPNFTGFELLQIDTITKKEKQLTKLGDTRNPSYSPDGKTIVFERSTGIFEINADGTGLRQITNIYKDPGAVGHQHPTYSPDGTMIAFHCTWKTGKMVPAAEGDGECEEIAATICTVKTNGTGMKRLVPGWSPCWMTK